MKVNEFEKNLRKSLVELDKYFDSIYNDLEQCLSKGVEESLQSCVAATKKLIAPVSVIHMFCTILIITVLLTLVLFFSLLLRIKMEGGSIKSLEHCARTTDAIGLKIGM